MNLNSAIKLLVALVSTLLACSSSEGPIKDLGTGDGPGADHGSPDVSADRGQDGSATGDAAVPGWDPRIGPYVRGLLVAIRAGDVAHGHGLVHGQSGLPGPHLRPAVRAAQRHRSDRPAAADERDRRSPTSI